MLRCAEMAAIGAGVLDLLGELGAHCRDWCILFLCSCGNECKMAGVYQDCRFYEARYPEQDEVLDALSLCNIEFFQVRYIQ